MGSGTLSTPVKLYFEDHGSGEPVILLHGALGTGATDFPAQIEAFRQPYRVIAPDLRGYGKSRPPSRDFPPDFYRRDADDVIALADQLGLDTFRLMGWSDGANAGTILAAAHPGRVSQLVVWAGNSFVSDEEVDTFREMRSVETWSPRARASLEPIYGSELGRIWADYVDCLIELHARGGNLYRDQLPLIACPVLILHGGKDPLVPPFHPEVLQAGIPNSSVHYFPEGKHNIHAKYASEFNAVVTKFFGAAGIGRR